MNRKFDSVFIFQLFLPFFFFFFTSQVIGAIRATDKDEQPATYRFSLASQSSNFSLRDYGSKSYTPAHRFVGARRSKCFFGASRTCCYATGKSAGAFCCRHSKVTLTSKSIFLVFGGRRRGFKKPVVESAHLSGMQKFLNLPESKESPGPSRELCLLLNHPG